jgi:hypothetical protein
MMMHALAILRGGVEVEPLRNTAVVAAAERITPDSGGLKAVAAVGAEVEHGQRLAAPEATAAVEEGTAVPDPAVAPPALARIALAHNIE